MSKRKSKSKDPYIPPSVWNPQRIIEHLIFGSDGASPSYSWNDPSPSRTQRTQRTVSGRLEDLRQSYSGTRSSRQTFDSQTGRLVDNPNTLESLEDTMTEFYYDPIGTVRKKWKGATAGSRDPRRRRPPDDPCPPIPPYLPPMASTSSSTPHINITVSPNVTASSTVNGKTAAIHKAGYQAQHIPLPGDPGHPLMRDIEGLDTWNGMELKFFDGGHQSLLGTVWSTSLLDPPAANCLNAIVRGTTGSTRIGRTTHLHHLDIRGQCTLPSVASQDTPNSNAYRIIIFIDHQTNGVLPNMNDVMLNAPTMATYLGFRNLSYKKRFHILIDETFPITRRGGEFNRSFGVFSTWDYKIPLNLKVIHKGDLGTVADISDNSIHIAIVAAIGSDPVSANYNYRFRFRD